MKSISVLGSTGSIGVSTLDVVAEFPDKFRVVALSAGRQIELLADQIRRFKPDVVSVANPADCPRLQALVQDCSVEIVSGIDGVVSCATHPQAQMVVSAIVGAAGLVPTMAAIEAGKDIALANKETLVTAGALIMDAVQRHKVNLLPVDSEHSAIYQSLSGHQYADVRRLILTASGGPFREFSRDQLEHVTLEQALNHPNWTMGAKITIDSATMMNKGLEVIEAYWLFNIPAEHIDVHIHPQSIVHSMVEYIDGSVVAQLGIPDMKTPIAYALAWPDRLPLSLPALDLCQWADLSFSRPDLELFPCLKLAYEALAEGGSAPIVLNAANEIAVEEFLQQNIQYLDISSVIRQVLDQYRNESIHSIDDVLHCDDRARCIARELIAQGR
ncbi:1-deoxy-D-xylulose-5-phosphate reductoisomerase [Desulfuromonas acetoxidans]|uniref:1-deoxy-D-xylulose-5-phosphate reductoisomerase n=1 Tax=Desulfuromonas acetoxidans TaxID=891 RepID=UPI00292FBC82|nr:1-deoxy-D-xylulose-5-phosphate reductoisomerase [Desulfuromonas acetoxidans]